MRIAPQICLAHCLRAVALWLALICGASAQRSYAVVLDQAQGLDAGEIAALAQDRAGFIWIGANGGLLRYDGARFVWWDNLHGLFNKIIAGKSGEVIAATESGETFSVAGNRLVRMLGPSGRPVTRAGSIAFDEDGDLWAVIAQQLWVRDKTGKWSAISSDHFGDEIPVRLNPLKEGVGLLTDRSAWLLHDRMRFGERLMTGTGLFAIAETENAKYWIADHLGTGLWRVDGHDLRQVGRPQGRLMSMTTRDNTLWVSIDRFLLSIDPENRKRVQGLKEGIPSGGPLLVDRDGALWLGTFIDLMRFPEPDTWQWTEEDGLPSNHAHGLALIGNDVWVNTWQGAARFVAGDFFDSPHSAANVDGNLCADESGGAWMASHGQMLHWQRDIYTPVAQVAQNRDLQISSCVTISDGRVLVATSAGLYLADSTTARAQLIARGLRGRTGIDSAWSAGSRDLWLVDEKEACRFDVDAVLQNRATPPRDCAELPPSTAMSSGLHAGRGVEWLPLGSGLMEIRYDVARRLPGNASLPGASIQRLTPSPRGGYWAAGPGTLLRIARCGSCAAGWRLLEKPGAAQGIPGNSAVDVLETPAGDVWIAGNRGVFRIPAQARVQPTRPKTLVLVTATVDGAPVNPAETITIDPAQHRLELIYSALYFRDPSALLYRYRLSSDATWSSPTSEPVLQLIDQMPGRYEAQLEASLDGRNWTAPAAVGFVALPPFWKSTPAFAVYGLLFIALLVFAYQVRVRHLLSLQHQRLSIARDLHDDLGSSLGSIVALTGVLSSPATDVSARGHVAGQISSAAQLAGAGLRSLVWTLRKEAVDAAAFGREIAEQAQRLAPQPPPLLTFALLGDGGAVRFDAELRRHVLMIVLEAVHNAVRHGEANVLSISFESRESRWLLAIADDGRGFDTMAPRMGSGLESMRWRAKKLGGTLAVESAPGQGTRIALEFALRRRNLLRWREPAEKDHA